MKKMILLFIVLLSLPVPAETVKVVSLAPAVTEIILAIGGKAQLAGRSTSCDMPEVRNIPAVGDLGSPFVEPVLKSRAWVILSDIQAPGQQWKILQRCGVQVKLLPAKNVDDLPGNIRAAGRVLNKNSAAEKAARQAEKEIAALRGSLPVHRVRALVVISLPTLVSCGKDSFLNSALALAGVENICGEVKRDYFVPGSEYIVDAAPEAIISFMPPETTEKFFARREYRNIPAVKAGKIFYVDANRLCRLTPQLPGALRELRQMLVRQ